MSDYDIITVYGAHTTVDEYGRSGGMKHLTRTKEEATHLAERIGYFNGPGTVLTYSAIVLEDGTMFLLQGTRPILFSDQQAIENARLETVRVAALLKLTTEEKKVLGL